MDKKTIFFLCISFVILGVMLYLVGVDKVIDALNKSKKEYVVIAIILQVFTYYLYTLRWKILNDVADINFGIKKLLPIVMVGLAVNNITPSGRGGGEPVRAYILAREGNYLMRDTFATVIADRALDTLPFVVLAIITIIGMTLTFKFDLWLMVIMAVAVIVITLILILLIFMSINRGFGLRVEGWIFSICKRFSKKDPEVLEKRIHSSVSGFQDTMSLVIHNKKALYLAVPLSFMIWIFEITRVYFVFLAFGANINPIIIGEVFILASLAGMIPLLPGGVGAVDSIMVVFYSAAGITTALSAAATFVERLISFWLAIVIGLIILPHYGSSVLDSLSFSFSKDENEESQDETEDT